MNTIKVKTIKSDEFAGMYYQGEYGVDLSKTYAEVPPAFADHLVGAGLAEYLKKDEIKRAAPPENAPVFVARELPPPPPPSPAQPVAPPIPTEEITLGGIVNTDAEFKETKDDKETKDTKDDKK